MEELALIKDFNHDLMDLIFLYTSRSHWILMAFWVRKRNDRGCWNDMQTVLPTLDSQSNPCSGKGGHYVNN